MLHEINKDEFDRYLQFYAIVRKQITNNPKWLFWVVYFFERGCGHNSFKLSQKLNISTRSYGHCVFVCRLKRHFQNRKDIFNLRQHTFLNIICWLFINFWIKTWEMDQPKKVDFKVDEYFWGVTIQWLQYVQNISNTSYD